jgi:hypothetical protein
MRILTPLFASYGKHVIVASNPFRVSSELCTSAGEYWPTGDWERLIRGLDRLEQRPEFSMLGVAVTRLHVQPGILEMMIRGQLL